MPEGIVLSISAPGPDPVVVPLTVRQARALQHAGELVVEVLGSLTGASPALVGAVNRLRLVLPVVEDGEPIPLRVAPTCEGCRSWDG